MNFNFLLRLKGYVDNNLNEFIKWVILLGLYGFYRMLSATVETPRIMFLIIPLVVASQLVFTLSWILDNLVDFLVPASNASKQRKIKGMWTFIFLLTGILSMLGFFIFEYVPLFNLGFCGFISSSLAYFWDKKDPWYYLSIFLFITGVTGVVFSFVQNNGIPVVSAVFYGGFTVFYFYRLIKIRKKTSPPGLQG